MKQKHIWLCWKSRLLGYAISLNSGVPRSKIYEVLGGLVDRGEVMVSHENPALYTPLPPNELINLKKRKAESSFEVAEEALENYSYVSLNRENIWNITGYEPILNRTKEAIKEATGRILLEIWGRRCPGTKRRITSSSQTRCKNFNCFLWRFSI